MIRFPKMHIAKSTVNRILNIADELEPVTIDTPSIPEGDTASKSLQIDAALASPTPEVAAPPGMGLAETLGPESIL
jgi:hypothetical protein